MQTIGPLFAGLLVILVYGIGIWITWKFYRALASIGEELSGIRELLRERLPRPDRQTGV